MTPGRPAAPRPPAATPPADAPPVTRRDVWVNMLLYPRHTVPTAAAPALVAAGLALHDGVFAPLPLLAAFVAGWLVQLGGVIADNYNNLRRHPHDREHALFVRALRAGVVRLGELWWAVVACYAAAVLLGLYLLSVGGVPVLVIGIASIVASLAYSSGPFPLGDRALGDPLFFVFFGIVQVGGIYYVQAASVLADAFPVAPPPGSVPWTAVVAGLPVAALTTNILVIDNIRDLDFDRDKGETTIAVLIGPRWSRVEYLALLAFAYLVPVALWISGARGAPVLLPLLSLPYGIAVARRVLRGRTYPELLPLTPQAGQALVLYCALFAAGLAAG